MNNNYVTAFAPASIGNVAVGFDILGLAIESAGDRVSARRVEEPGVHIKEIYDEFGEIHMNLSKEASKNTASISALDFIETNNIDFGVELIIHKGIPLQSGMGSSAASAVAGVVAVNALLDEPLGKKDLLMHAIEGEKFASAGLHADNVAPSLFGGLVFCPQDELPNTIQLNLPNCISSIVLHPDLSVNTAESRASLKANYPLSDLLKQQSYLSGFILGVKESNLNLIERNLKDIIIEPQRSSAISCFEEVKNTAMENGAIGCSISGSGPSIFALCKNDDAELIASKMKNACENHDLKCETWISQSNSEGAVVE